MILVIMMVKIPQIPKIALATPQIQSHSQIHVEILILYEHVYTYRHIYAIYLDSCMHLGKTCYILYPSVKHGLRSPEGRNAAVGDIPWRRATSQKYRSTKVSDSKCGKWLL